ncbi:MAG: Tim44 domain-containing protein, partial [Burkholderiales bacterium]|nr:Tim44 domain-containing protein [Burkholderiales bacterium]
AVNPQRAAPKAPAQQQQQTAPAAPAQPAAAGNKWLAPLTGLALGAGLAALFFNNGLAGVLAGVLVLMLIVAAAVFLVRMLRGGAAARPLQFAGAGTQSGRRPYAEAPGGGAPYPTAVAAGWPAGFDAEPFVRHARLNFVRLQAVHDARDLSTIRDFLTPEMYAEIDADMRAMDDAPQKTEIVFLNAEVLDVTTENDLHIVSVRFSGMIREAEDAAPQEFSEIWHLEKPVRGRSGWLVSGIQQH